MTYQTDQPSKVTNDFLSSNIINVSQTIKRSFFGMKFEDNKMEEDFLKSSINKSTQEKVILHVMYFSNCVYIIFFQFLNFDYVSFFSYLVFSIICLILVTFFYKLKIYRWKRICEKITSFSFIFFQGLNTILLETISENKAVSLVIRANLNLFLFTISEILLSFESNYFITLVLFLYDLAISAIIKFKINSLDYSYNEVFICVICILTFSS